MEHKLYEALLAVGRATVQNSVIPNQPRISEHKRAFLLEFFEHLKLLVSTLGFPVFEPRHRIESQPDDEKFHTRAARGADATALLTNEGMVVLSNSRVAYSVVASASDWVTNLRLQLQHSGVLSTNWIFLKDHTFASPSTPAAVVMGRNANGLTQRRNAVRNALKVIEES